MSPKVSRWTVCWVSPVMSASGTAGSRSSEFLGDPVFLSPFLSLSWLQSQAAFLHSGDKDGCQAPLQNTLQMYCNQKGAGWGVGRG